MSKIVTEVILENVTEEDLSILRQRIDSAVETYLIHESKGDTTREDWKITYITTYRYY